MGIRVTRKIECFCYRCGKTWIPKLPLNRIIKCPKCSSPYWNRKRKEKTQ